MPGTDTESVKARSTRLRGRLSAIRRALMLAGLWLVLAGTGADAALVGTLAVPAATWMSLYLLPPQQGLRLLRLAAMIPGFLWRSFLGGVDVAWRVFHPALPLAPGWLKLPVTLPDGGKVALGAELSLMPGTLVAGSEGSSLLVHVLDTERDIEGALRVEEARLATLVARAHDLHEPPTGPR